jgi:hypothetical protein
MRLLRSLADFICSKIQGSRNDEDVLENLIEEEPIKETVEKGEPCSWVVRSITHLEKEWREASGEANKLTEDRFSKDPAQAVSTFIANDTVQEFENISALETKRPGQSFGLAVRIKREEIEEMGIRMDSTNTGTTGVPTVDARHIDLFGEPASFLKLTQHLLDRIKRGEDRLRLVHKTLLKSQWNNFLRDPEITDEELKATLRKKV